MVAGRGGTGAASTPVAASVCSVTSVAAAGLLTFSLLPTSEPESGAEQPPVCRGLQPAAVFTAGRRETDNAGRNLGVLTVVMTGMAGTRGQAGPTSLFLLGPDNIFRRLTIFIIEWPPFEWTVLATIIASW